MMVKLKVKIVHNLYQFHKQGFKVLLLQYDDDLAMFSHLALSLVHPYQS